MTHLTTNVELIQRLSNREDQEAWNEFVQIYEPMLMRTASKLGLNRTDSVDAVQEVFIHLGKAILSWKPIEENAAGERGSFRGWLVRVARNQMIKLIERSNVLKSESTGSAASDLLATEMGAQTDDETYFNIEFRRQVFLYVVQKIRKCFKEKTWQAFWLTYIDQRQPQEVAQELGVSLGAVYISRSRVMSRLQSEIKVLVNDEWTELMSADLLNDPALTLSFIRDCSIISESHDDASGKDQTVQTEIEKETDLSAEGDADGT
ncbi:MAG: RNA polymerase sigma factor [Mariniblastus sp.]